MVSPRLHWRVAVIGDVVGSREVADRAALHECLMHALALTNGFCDPVEPLAPTVGDEFQGSFNDVFSALDATLLVRVTLPPEYDVRFGVGVGAVLSLGGERRGFPHQDGPAWWVARDAVEHVASSRRDVPGSLRTWLAAARVEDDDRVRAPVDLEDRPVVCALNAFLATRDHLASAMDGRDRRIMRDLIRAQTVREIAAAEGISPSAVSQRIGRSGAAAIIAARESLRAGLWSSVPPEQRRHPGGLWYPTLEEVFAH